MWEKFVAFFMSVIMTILSLFGLEHLIDNGGIRKMENVSYGTHERQVLDLYLPENLSDVTGLVLCIHGGAWIGGDKSAYTESAKDLCKNMNIATATINYRYLSPDVSMYEIIDDVDAAVAKIREIGKENGTDINKMLLTGHSAGAHLSMLYAYSRADTAAITPAAVANFSGPTDLNDKNYFIDNDLGTDNVLMLVSYATGRMITLENFEERKDEIDRVAPLYYVNENTVPTIICHGMKDTIVPYSNAVSLDAKLTQYGVTHDFISYPNSGHGLESDREQAGYAEELMVKYLNEYVLK